MPDKPACLRAPTTSPSMTRRMELVVTEKSPLVGLAVWAPITLFTMKPLSSLPTKASQSSVGAELVSINSVHPVPGGDW